LYFLLLQVQKYVLGDGQCSVTVLPAATAVHHIIRVLPYVFNDSKSIICFLGYLSNLQEVSESIDNKDKELAFDGDVGTVTASVVLRLCQQMNSTSSHSQEIMLSELQVNRESA
jgi:hypothetical protein